MPFQVEVTNKNIEETRDHGEGLVAAFANGCIIPSLSLSQLNGPESAKPVKVSFLLPS